MFLSTVFVPIFDLTTNLLQAGDTPLMVAAEQGHEVVVRMLLRSGADKNYQNEANGKASPALYEEPLLT